MSEDLVQADILLPASTEKSPNQMYERGDIRVEHLGNIRLDDGRRFVGAIITFPAGLPVFQYQLCGKERLVS